MGIRLTPTGQLRWQPAEADATASDSSPLQSAFEADWREALFILAAEKIEAQSSSVVRFWRQFAERYLTRLCHIPEDAEVIEVEAPSPADCAHWVLTAPPMPGGEYLSEETLQRMWERLHARVLEAIRATGGLAEFLHTRAPKWQQVGRVCFHLAENKRDEARPFAFMATYASGFGAGGQLKHLPLRKALEQYAGAKNRAALIKLLSPVQKAAETCDWVKELVESSEMYQPMAWSAARAYRLLRSVPELEASGLSVRLPNWWRKRARPQVSVTIGSQTPSNFGLEAMLDFDVTVALGGEPLSPEELQALLSGEDDLVLLKGQWVEVDRDKLQQAIAHWERLQQQARDGEISFVEGMRLLAGASADLEHEELTEDEHPWVHVEAGEAMREILSGLRHPGASARALDEAEVGKTLQGTLRPYQLEGLVWLRFLTRLGLGACLADDMGLGKTIQVLALLLRNQHDDTEPKPAPSLLVIPASLLGNWRSEAVRFAPSLKLCFLHPAETDRQTLTDIAAAPEQHLADADLVVTTYAMLTRQPWLADVHWRLVILDEAQAIKNPSTRQSRAARKLSAQARIALTGTPVENRLGDLWALFDFLNPGLLGSAKVFQSFVKSLQARDENPFTPLRQLVSPYILRRLKTDRSIIADLPEKTEMAGYCHLTRPQVKLYEQVVRAMQHDLESTDDMARRGVVLRSLLRLKQVCNHPSQLLGDADYKPADSGKFLRLADICEELAARQEKVLIFTQFREIIEPLAEHLAAIFGQSGLVLHGATRVKERRALVDQFQRDDGPPFFILSLKAGGTGLNLTAASHVIHFDRWWNPAVENQATDRAFRIGQHRNVWVHKFLTRGTVEERIDRMIAEKQQLADDILVGDSEVNLTELSDDDLLDLVRLDITRAAV
jgi:SNF2 family DNA or RNA helicase